MGPRKSNAADPGVGSAAALSVTSAVYSRDFAQEPPGSRGYMPESSRPRFSYRRIMPPAPVQMRSGRPSSFMSPPTQPFMAAFFGAPLWADLRRTVIPN